MPPAGFGAYCIIATRAVSGQLTAFFISEIFFDLDTKQIIMQMYSAKRFAQEGKNSLLTSDSFCANLLFQFDKNTLHIYLK